MSLSETFSLGLVKIEAKKKKTINQMNYLPFLRVIPDHLRTFFPLFYLLSIFLSFLPFSTQLTSLILHFDQHQEKETHNLMIRTGVRPIHFSTFFLFFNQIDFSLD